MSNEDGYNTAGSSLFLGSGSDSSSLDSVPDTDQETQRGDSTHSTSHLSNSSYNRRCKELLQLDRDLRELGAQMLFDLPRISVIGSQSAGKSSLVEAVSGINVPRDSGTCTRCPMECTMSQAESWSCTISLHLGKTGVDFHSERFGPTLQDKADVEIWLRRAQAAILSPHINSSEFYDKTKAQLDALREADDRVLQFSQNTIHVDVKGPEVTGLSFVDLPGLIQNSDTPKLIDLVKRLVESNIKGEQTLILIAIPMSDDIENQQAVRLAKEADSTGERTIGVLTKPDVVLQSSIGQLQKWKEVLEGKAHKLEHGYYCVRLPDEAERVKNLSREESEKLANKFFRTRSPWSEMHMRSRFGVPNLVKDISALLVQWIEKNLPNLRNQLDGLLAECNDELSDLPPPPSNEPSTEILLRVEAFARGFQDAVNATENKTLVQQARERYGKYKIEILRTSPDFRPFIDYKQYRQPPAPANYEGDPDQYRTPPMDLVYVRQVIKDSIGWELPGHVPYAATLKLINESIRLWREPSLACFNDTYRMTADMIERLIREHFSRFPKAESYIRLLVNAELEECKSAAQQSIEQLLQSESRPVFTQNLHYFETEQRRWHNHYKNIKGNPSKFSLSRSTCEASPSRAVVQNVTSPGPPRESPMSVPAQSVYSVYGAPSRRWEEVEVAECVSYAETGTTSVSVVDEKPPGPNDYSEELILMSRVHAYFRIAYKRIIDQLPLTIEHSLNRTLEATLSKKIWQKLAGEPNYAQKMAELVTESFAISEKRRLLSGKKQKLMQIKCRLDQLGN